MRGACTAQFASVVGPLKSPGDNTGHPRGSLADCSLGELSTSCEAYRAMSQEFGSSNSRIIPDTLAAANREGPRSPERAGQCFRPILEGDQAQAPGWPGGQMAAPLKPSPPFSALLRGQAAQSGGCLSPTLCRGGRLSQWRSCLPFLGQWRLPGPSSHSGHTPGSAPAGRVPVTLLPQQSLTTDSL